MKIFLFVLILTLNYVFAQNDTNFTWAILVAGSKGWSNYRHQADVLHAYEMLTKFYGVKKNNIILMVYDDLVNSTMNPSKGIIINEFDEENLYKDIEKDFINEEVTVDNFLKVLKGDEQLLKKGKKVLKSNSNENVIIYYSDHGSPGLINFPNEILRATTFIQTLESLSANKKFNKMAIYIEACYSGSLFQTLLKSNLNIYAVTAANSTQVSYAEEYDTNRKTFLADVFSLNWIHSSIDCSKKNLTLEKQFEVIKSKTNTSEVSQFGDIELAKNTYLNDFLNVNLKKENSIEKCVLINKENQLKRKKIVVPNQDTYIKSLEIESSKSLLKEKFDHLILKHKSLQKYFKDHFISLGIKFSKFLNLSTEHLFDNSLIIKNHECYENLAITYHQYCYKLNENYYLSNFLSVFYNSCNSLENYDKEIKNEKENHLKNLIIKHCEKKETKKMEY